MTDGPDCVPVWKKVGKSWFAWVQEGWEDGKWVEDEHMTFTRWLRERILEVETARASIDFHTEPKLVVGKGGQLTAFKQVLDFYESHFVTYTLGR